MPDALILAESKLPALLVEYLAFRRDDEDYPMPAANVLPLVAMPVKETTERSTPSLEVWCPAFQVSTRRDEEVIEAYLDLHASPSTSQATEDGWLAVIRRALAGGPLSGGGGTGDVDPFLTWCDSLTTEQKTGWQIDNLYVAGGATTVEGRDRRIIRRTIVRAVMRTNVLTV